jgi:ribosomal protein L9
MDFDFGTSEPAKEEHNDNEINTSEPPQQNNDGFMNMDFLTNPPQSQQPQTTLDNIMDMNFQPSPQSQNTGMNLNNLNNLNTKVDEEEIKRNEAREKEAQERRERINQKIQKEEELRSQILKKASEYMREFEAQRQENIAKRRKALEEKNNNINQNKEGGSNADSWGRINSNIDLKDSEYKGSQDVQRMREAMMNRTNDTNSEPLQKFFG